MPYPQYPHLEKTLSALKEAWFLGAGPGQEYVTRIEAAFDSRLSTDWPQIDQALSLGFYALHTESHKQQRLALRAVLLANYLTDPQQDPRTISGGLRSKYESLSTDALKHEFVSLMSAGTQLVGTFTTIRGYNIARNAAHPGGTLAPADVRALLTLSSSISAPLVVVTPNIGPPAGAAAALGNGSKVDITFRTTFRSNVQAAMPNRVIRFVRAAEVNNSFNGTEQKRTVPGYVHYVDDGPPSRVPASRTSGYFRQKLAASYLHANWSFDGPHQEFVNGLSNEDNPGTNFTVKPYAITAEFLIVLYNETAKLVYEVGHSAASFAAWDDGTSSFTRLAGIV
jgi:hypothetical protein